ncbi:CocE/NonD family hydrolase [Symmachiella dynata]|uniref:CocE/NonD family hydrolase n=1 Tax=Symmachiella dynata TaxID=2527995 RepID=UPI0030EE5E5E
MTHSTQCGDGFKLGDISLIIPAGKIGPPMHPRSIPLNIRCLSLNIFATAILMLTLVGSIAAADKIDLGDVREKHVMIPMRDGKKLSAYLYFPAGKGPWPALFEQRYGGLQGTSTRKAAAELASEGFVVALVNFRGTHLSEGTYVGYRALQWGELQDGYDSCEWLADQDWCTGKIGTFGSSQGGYAQNYLAVTEPPHLVCQYMTDTGLSLFEEGYRIGGTTRPERFQGMAGVCRDPEDNARLLAEWFAHPHYDEYWQAEDCTLHFGKMNVPCMTIGSWYDFMNQGSIASFQGRQHQGGPNSRGKQQLVIGPWLHGRLNKGNRVGQLVYPKNAIWPVREHMVRWFNHYLKGEENGVEQDPTVRYYVMGALGEGDAPGNVWRTAKDFPPPAKPVEMFLQTDGMLSTATPPADGGSTSYTSDPLHPMQIPGRGFPGATDARPFEEQTEVRTFTTEPLTKPVEWTGRVQAELYVSSTARDTDFIVRISDVYPDGRSILIVDYPWRARYREGFDHETLMTPGEVTKIAFPVGWMSQIFNAGHRIRVTIASTGAPLYEPNPQTGKPLTIEFPDDAVSAVNTIHHNRKHASRIIAPVPE